MDCVSSFAEFINHHIFSHRYGLKNNRYGFTLIELLVVVGIISILITAVALLFNPLAQIQKTRNANREQDLNHIKAALDTYLNDTGCYPTNIPFGSKWAVGSTVYMEKVPQDPDCSATNPTYCYDYQTDNTSCPQWNILYATMHQPIAASVGSCVLTKVAGCLPTGGLFSYNYCTVSGKLDCTYLSQNALPTPIPPGGGAGVPTATPTPSINCSGSLSACSNGICNVESANQCLGCGGTMQCYQGLTCGGVKCQ